MPQHLRVVFRRVHVRRDGDWFGSGEWYFNVTVNGASVGRSTVIFDTARPIEFTGSAWQATVDVSAGINVPIVFQAKDKDLIFDDDMGTIRHTLRRPYTQGGVRTEIRECQNYLLEYDVLLEAAGGYGPHPAGTIFATRQNPGAGTVQFDTVAGVSRASRFEICPIWPVPPDGNMPPRPAVPGGVAVFQGGVALTDAEVNPAADINVVPNPAVIPILSPPGAGPPPAGGPPRATAQTAARIECTYYWPSTLNFTPNDARLQWEITPAANASFLGGNRGRNVTVYGTNQGNVTLRVSFQGTVCAEYCAIVRPLRQIPFRANILNGPNAHSQPTAGPADVENHIAIANRFLRQLALQLVPDSNTNRTHGARPTDRAGVFRVSVSANRTRNVTGAQPRASILNSRPNVLNIQYIHSIDGGAFGQATDRPASNHGATVSDNLTPTPSWLRVGGGGCGVLPDTAPTGPLNMQLRPALVRASFPNRFALLVTSACGDPTTAAGSMYYGNVIAHELGHVLNLCHRTGGGPDGLGGHPPQQNVMCQGQPPTIRQDFDRIQGLAVRGSPLVGP